MEPELKTVELCTLSSILMVSLIFSVFVYSFCLQDCENSCGTSVTKLHLASEVSQTVGSTKAEKMHSLMREFMLIYV